MLESKIYNKLVWCAWIDSNMASVKYEVEKFAIQNDFGLWLLKMWALPILQGVGEALRCEVALDVKLKEKGKKDIDG